MDRILIRDLFARCTLGVTEDERKEKQDVVVNVALSADLAPVAKADSLEGGVDYKAVKKRVLAVVESSQFQLLEALAEAIAQSCLESPQVDEVTVTVDKPGALRFAKSVAVQLVRRRK